MTVPLLAVVRFQSVTGLPEDVVDMDFSFDAANSASSTLDGIAESISDFFRESNVTNPMSGYLGKQISRTEDAETVFYDLTGHLDGTPHGSPIANYNFPVEVAITGNAFPAECAIVMSFHSDLTGVSETAANPSPPPAVIRPAARRRGRIYFGPLQIGATDYNASNDPIPGSTFLADLEAAVFRFMDERPDFAVWSRADATMYTVADGGAWTCDNVLDTQRRRGPDATARTAVWP